MSERGPLTIATQGSQSAIDGGRSGAIFALAVHSPVTQIFMAKQRRVERPASQVFPPDDEMG
jgi:hypothetical protein